MAVDFAAAAGDVEAGGMDSQPYPRTGNHIACSRSAQYQKKMGQVAGPSSVIGRPPGQVQNCLPAPRQVEISAELCRRHCALLEYVGLEVRSWLCPADPGA